MLNALTTIIKDVAEAMSALLEHLFGVRHLGHELLVNFLLAHAVLQLSLVEVRADVVVFSHSERIVHAERVTLLFLAGARESGIQLVEQDAGLTERAAFLLWRRHTTRRSTLELLLVLGEFTLFRRHLRLQWQNLQRSLLVELVKMVEVRHIIVFLGEVEHVYGVSRLDVVVG